MGYRYIACSSLSMNFLQPSWSMKPSAPNQTFANRSSHKSYKYPSQLSPVKSPNKHPPSQKVTLLRRQNIQPHVVNQTQLQYTQLSHHTASLPAILPSSIPPGTPPGREAILQRGLVILRHVDHLFQAVFARCD